MTPYLIGVAGPSCAGKSYLAAHLAARLDAVLFRLDWYYRELDHPSLAERAAYNFDSPEALEFELLMEHVRRLQAGETILRPVYDFHTHTRTGELRELSPRRFVIVEGLFALYWEPLRAALQAKIYVELDEQLCLQRRIERDMRERGRTRESVLEQYRATVVPMARQYLYPTRTHADLILAGDCEIAQATEAVIRHLQESAGIWLSR
jgi:uridine kinase